ncbi:stage V sporulation protein D [Clostridiaceae bacterium M8S5]|nr:stage V sporulation protein D [Clostridiaceae bacterium M8S5]
MNIANVTTRKRIFIMLVVAIVVFVLLVGRLSQIQILDGDKLRNEALEQWTKDIPVRPKRGTIYDRNGKVMATNINLDTVWCRPADITNPKKTASVLSQLLEMDEEKIYKLITKRQSLVEIKRWIEKDISNKIRKQYLKGIEIVDDNKRYYTYGQIASHIIGHTDSDNKGQYGVERTYNKELEGVSGRWIKTVDAKQKELPYGNERLYEAKNGQNLVLTLDETIQHFAEKAAYEALVKNKAKHASIIIMDPKTGDILAMATKPDYNLNDKNTLQYNPESPWELLTEDQKEVWDNKPWVDKSKQIFDAWRNFPVNDNYEPGSTFKIITAAAGLEEGVVSKDSRFHCDGFVRQVKSYKPIKCWRYYNPHGSQTFLEGVQNSCNEVFVEVGLRIGAKKMYDYIKAFGFGKKTGIKLTGEQSGIIPADVKYIKEINLATISFGQGIAVTPIQLLTAVSAIANGGNLMKPRIVKEIVDDEGNLIKENKTKVVRRVVSEKTSKTLLEILESVVSVGTGKKAYVKGYHVGGKTGTAQKVIDGRYAQGRYIASFMAVAPAYDPQICALIIIDEPTNGIYYGGQIAAPVAGAVVEDTLKYLNLKPRYTEEELNSIEKNNLKVPDVRNKTITEAGKMLSSMGLKYNTDIVDVKKGDIVIDQYPLPGTTVKKGHLMELYINGKQVN